MTIDHIFLDMDGVLCDFIASAAKLHNYDLTANLWPAGVWDCEAVFGCADAAAFWKPIHEAGRAFWSDMAPLEWMRELYALLIEVAPVTILTSPSKGACCPSGKVDWLHKHFGTKFHKYIIGSQKHLVSAPGRLLVDDADKNVNPWLAAGGQAILFPQPWNTNHSLTVDRLGYVRQQLEAVAAAKGST